MILTNYFMELGSNEEPNKKSMCLLLAIQGENKNVSHLFIQTWL